MRVLVIGGLAQSLINFRGPLLEAMLRAGHEVVGCAGEVEASVVERLREMGVGFREVELERRGTSIVGDWRYYRNLKRVVRETRPQVVLTYTIKPVVYGCRAAARAKVPLIAAMITGAGAAQKGTTLKERSVGFALRRLYAGALRRTHVVFFQNPDDEALFRSAGCIGDARVVQIPGSGVDLAHYGAAPPVLEPVTFLMIARLLVNKGVRVYAQAASDLKARYGDDVRCVLVGWFEPGSGAVTEREVEEWTATGAVEYAGATDDVRPFLRASSVYVLPSYREGHPRTVLEAMATGRPVITTDCPGCRETVENGLNGFLVPPGDPRALRGAMERFVHAPELIEEMGRRSRERAERVYDVHHVNEVILSELGLA